MGDLVRLVGGEVGCWDGFHDEVCSIQGMWAGAKMVITVSTNDNTTTSMQAFTKI